MIALSDCGDGVWARNDRPRRGGLPAGGIRGTRRPASRRRALPPRAACRL